MLLIGHKEYRRYADQLTAAVQQISHNKELLDAFLADILSPAEYREVVTRWQIVTQLYHGISQRQIAKDLHVSIATITRGSRELLDREGGFRKVLKKLYPKK